MYLFTLPVAHKCHLPVDHNVNLCGTISHCQTDFLTPCLEAILPRWKAGSHCKSLYEDLCFAWLWLKWKVAYTCIQASSKSISINTSDTWTTKLCCWLSISLSKFPVPESLTCSHWQLDTKPLDGANSCWNLGWVHTHCPTRDTRFTHPQAIQQVHTYRIGSLVAQTLHITICVISCEEHTILPGIVMTFLSDKLQWMNRIFA